MSRRYNRGRSAQREEHAGILRSLRRSAFRCNGPVGSFERGMRVGFLLAARHVMRDLRELR